MNRKPYSIKCCFGFHKWKLDSDPVKPYETNRECDRCGKRQTACFDGIEICWGHEIPKQVHPPKIKSSKEMYDELDKRTSTKEIDESLYQGCVMARHNFKKLKKADVNIEGLDDCIEKLDKALSIDSKISAAPPLGQLCVYGNCPDCGSMASVKTFSNVGICDSCGATLKRIGCHCDGLPTAFGDVIFRVTKKGNIQNKQFNKEGDDRK